jgi:hypothetical protein
MSMELHVLSNQRLDSLSTWQHSIDMQKFPLRIESRGLIDTTKGFVAAECGGVKTGLEIHHDDPAELARTYKGFDLGGPWRCVLSLRWGADLVAMRSAWVAAAAYAAWIGGVFDPQQSKTLAPQHARRYLQEIEQNLQPSNL